MGDSQKQKSQKHKFDNISKRILGEWVTEKVGRGQGNKNNSNCAQSTLFNLDRHVTVPHLCQRM